MTQAPKITLCVIAGNEARNIVRFLDSFAPAFDELSLVRAIGNQDPDQTFELARAWCERNGRTFQFQNYGNAPGNDWPHVDNFAAARNLAFSNATGDWLFWADCDDVAGEGITALREIAAQSAPDVLHLFPYNVLGTGKRPARERLISRELFAKGRCWRNAIHETLAAHPGDTMQEHVAPAWIHRPSGSAAPNRERNLRILSGQLRDTPTAFFYWHQELFTRGNAGDARKSGELVLAMPNMEPSFRYQAALNLCRLEPDNDRAVRHALAAHEIFPWCREAVAELVKIYMELAARAHVEHWLRVFESLDEPSPARRPWTHEPKWYGWAALDLRERAYRWLGQGRRARGIRKRRDYRVTLIHDTADASRAVAVREAWLDFAADPAAVRYIFAPKDAATARALAQFEQCWEHPSDGVRLITDTCIPEPGWDIGQSPP